MEVVPPTLESVLSQHSPADQKLQPCTFFSHHLSLDIGNRELLAVVLSLQEWRHLLDGVAHSFLVWTDDKNQMTELKPSPMGFVPFLLTYRT